ncbi:hypothetical protein [Rhodovulum kholense]|uniref:D-galactarate dehydratase n=1 Tax=Rhodovulum kholense TaxID=453584 RepID=A0A8E2VMZ3_9RHOB|nr:hypothetical protein [Rhodovulum kholense]PTW52090.1 hypothetical protein C8N38_101395 [Rhodovulum kholense]
MRRADGTTRGLTAARKLGPGLGLALVLAGCNGAGTPLGGGAAPPAEEIPADTGAPLSALGTLPTDGVPEATGPEAGAGAGSGAGSGTVPTAPSGLAEATAPVFGLERELGVTTASLGDPNEAGFWAVTPLVDETRRGRLADPVSGASVQVELRPSDSSPGAGTRVSMEALRALGLPPISLTNLKVYVSE